MTRTILILAGLALLLGGSVATAAQKERAQQTTLGVPAYPGWAVHRLDDKMDSSGKTRLYQYQYYSDDPPQEIVRFYEERVAATAVFMKDTYTYTVIAPIGATIQITAPPDGVPQTDDAGAPTGKTWTSLITIIRFQAQ